VVLSKHILPNVRVIIVVPISPFAPHWLPSAQLSGGGGGGGGVSVI